MPAKCDAAIMLKPINVKLLGIFFFRLNYFNKASLFIRNALMDAACAFNTEKEPTVVFSRSLFLLVFISLD